MKNHVKVYLEAFYPDWTNDQYFPCEICSRPAVDIHHIEARGMGGSKERDVPENLMGLCRRDHEKYGDKKQFKEYLKEVHEKFSKEAELRIEGRLL